MLKILVSLVSLFLVAVLVLSLRQERMDLTSQSAKLFIKINQRRHLLWGQQIKISAGTNPIAISKKLKARAAAEAAQRAAATMPALIAVPVNGATAGNQ
ncbi:MAG: hypothetical protein HKL95_04880 [Phycisphaerae bacterium]|nr:hypothetical protein [Phycisphaerae bacterium]